MIPVRIQSHFLRYKHLGPKLRIQLKRRLNNIGCFRYVKNEIVKNEDFFPAEKVRLFIKKKWTGSGCLPKDQS